MATDVAGRRYRTWYAMLLRLYPRPFRERFGEGMAQTFHDLCREHRDAKRGLYGLALWIFFETSVAIVRENTTHMSQLGKTMLRVALGALAVLMVPLVASQVVEGWNWDARAFVFVYVLFLGAGMVYAVMAGKMGAWSYKAGLRIHPTVSRRNRRGAADHPADCGRYVGFASIGSPVVNQPAPFSRKPVSRPLSCGQPRLANVGKRWATTRG